MHKKQGRRRSMPPTTLPSPDIEIGSRHPVNYMLPRIRTEICEPAHIGQKKARVGVCRPDAVVAAATNPSADWAINRSTPLGHFAVGVSDGVGSGANRLVARRRRSGCIGDLRAGKRLPQPVDRLLQA